MSTKFIVLTGSLKGERVFPVFKNADREECKVFDTVEEAGSEWATIRRKWPHLLVWVIAIDFQSEASWRLEQESMRNMLNRTGRALSKEEADQLWEIGQRLL